MKKLLLLIWFLFSLVIVFSQTVVNNTTPGNTIGSYRNMFVKNAYLPRYTDTTQANIAGTNLNTNNIGVDSCGAIIFTRSPQSLWYRCCSPKRWCKLLDISDTSLLNSLIQNIIDSSVNKLQVLNDSTLIICNGSGVCDTIHFHTSIINIKIATFVTDSSIRVCSVDTVNGGVVTICDTINIGTQPIVYLFQNGVRQYPGRIVELGENYNIGQGLAGPSQLQHPVALDVGYNFLTIPQKTIYDYGLQVRKYPNFGFQNGTGLQSWMHENDALAPNNVRLGVNYTDSIYQKMPTLITGYFGRTYVGYWIGVNSSGDGSFGLNTDNSISKIDGIFFHTKDTSNRDAITFFGKHPPNPNFQGPLDPYRVMTLYDTGDVRLYHYPSTRDDGASPKALYTDINGNIKLGNIATGSTAVLIDSTHIQFCNGNNNCDTITISKSISVTNVYVINDSTLLVCDTTNNCDTVKIPKRGFDRGFFDPNQASIGDVIHNGNLYSFQVINGKYYNWMTDVNALNAGSQGQIQENDLNVINSVIDSVGNGAYMWLNYFSGFPYPQFQLSSTWNTNSTQITGTASALTLNQNAGQLFFQNLTRGTGTDSALVINPSTGLVRIKSLAASITADNGLTDSVNRIILGGTLYKNTTINDSSFYLTLSGNNNNSNQGTLNVTNSSTSSSAIWATSNNGANGIIASSIHTGIFSTGTDQNGVYGSSTSGNGVKGGSSTGTGVLGQASNSAGLAGYFIQSGVSAAITTALRLEIGSGNSADNSGGSTDMYVTSSNGTLRLANQFKWKWATANDATRTSQAEIWGVNSASTNEIASFYGSGVVGIGNFSSYNATRLDIVDNSVGAAKMATFISSNTNAASNTQRLLSVELSGANATSNQITRGIFVQDAHTGSGSQNIGIDGQSINGDINYGGSFSSYGGSVNYAVSATVTNNSTINYGIYAATSGSSATNYGGYFSAMNGSGNYAVIVPSGGGKIGLGTDTPDSLLTVIGSTRLHGTFRLSTFGAGTLMTDGSGNVTATSDRRVKHDIKPFSLGLDNTLKLQPVTFVYNNDQSGTVMPGFIAQDVQSAYGGIGIDRGKDGYLTMNVNVIIAGLVNSVKELNKKIEDQQKEIDKLKSK
jgi:hypothetical protein